MRYEVGPRALRAGLRNETTGTHTTRTLMLDDLRTLLQAVRPDAPYADYVRAVVDENVLRKSTVSTRRKSMRHLRELYGLDPNVPLFRVLRELWSIAVAGQPLLALLCGSGRDPLLRCTADVVVTSPTDTAFDVRSLADAVSGNFPGRFTPDVLRRIGRNVASSWTQAGLLRGRSRKVRSKPVATHSAASFALFLGHLGGASGPALFETIWARMVEPSSSVLQGLAAASSRQGWIEYRAYGGVTEVTFRHFDTIVQAAQVA